MAGKVKPGITFYRMDSGHVTNKKVRLLMNEYDSDGYYIWKCLIDYGYGKWGYYFDMNDQEDLEFFASDICKKKITLVKEVINGCIRRGLFDKDVAKMFGILTSVMMQEVFIYATNERRKKGSEFEMQQDWLLLDFKGKHPQNILIIPGKDAFVPGKNGENPGNDAQTKTKTKTETKTEIKQQAPAEPLPVAGNSILLKTNFSEAFIQVWAAWKNYKLKEFRFKYKSEESESASLAELVNLSNKNEETAKAIILQSMAKGWKGFFELDQKPEVITHLNEKNQMQQIEKKQLSKKQKEINYLYERFLENQCTIISIEFDHYDFLKSNGLISFTEEQVNDIKEKSIAEFNKPIDQIEENALIRVMKKFGVLEFFRQMELQAKETVFNVD